MEYTLRRVDCTAKEAGSSRSSAARDGSCRWMSPRVAVLTGVEAPCAPPPARGGGMKKMSWCWTWIPAAGGRTMFWFLSTLCEGRILCNSLCTSWVLSDNKSARQLLDLCCRIYHAPPRKCWVSVTGQSGLSVRNVIMSKCRKDNCCLLCHSFSGHPAREACASVASAISTCLLRHFL